MPTEIPFELKNLGSTRSTCNWIQGKEISENIIFITLGIPGEVVLEVRNLGEKSIPLLSTRKCYSILEICANFNGIYGWMENTWPFVCFNYNNIAGGFYHQHKFSILPKNTGIIVLATSQRFCSELKEKCHKTVISISSLRSTAKTRDVPRPCLVQNNNHSRLRSVASAVNVLWTQKTKDCGHVRLGVEREVPVWETERLALCRSESTNGEFAPTKG